MANTPQDCPTDSALNVCERYTEVARDGVNYPPFLAQQVSSYGKRKKTSLEEDGSSLSLGLGCSMSSGITMFSSKEIEEESSGNLDLKVNLSTRNGQTNDLKSQLRIEGPKIDLELSLAAGSIESDVTTFTQTSIFPFRYNVSPTVQLVDEGSTSSRWKLPFLAEPLSHFHHVHGHSNPNPVIFQGVSEHRRNTNTKNCLFMGCTRGARGASGFCIAHGGGRRCQRDGCHKGAEGKTVFCKAHGGGRRCEYLGCTKSAEGRTDYCIGHGGGRRCNHDGCTRAARGKSGLCIRHGGGKRCKIETCTKSAEGISGLCISHGGGRRCQFPACTKGAQGSTMFCKAHGGGKRCSFLGCTKGAEGSTSFCKAHGGGKRCTFSGGCSKSVHGGTLFCVNHGGGKRCAVAECTKSARGRSSYCVRHGGGKRCKFEGCGKSAQGSTDFCKAHGGGKRCSWGQSQSQTQKSTPCDKFARGKTGFCASHGLLMQDASAKQVSGLVVEPEGYEHRSVKMDGLTFGQYSLPEGRVHGGSLMAMLRSSSNLALSGPSEPGEAYPTPHRSWV